MNSRKSDVQGVPLSVQRIHLKAIQNAAAIQRTMLDLLRAERRRKYTSVTEERILKALDEPAPPGDEK